MLVRVIDFETTGMPPEADVIEAAYVDVVGEIADPATGLMQWHANARGWTALVRPTRPIEVEARAAHHLSEAEVAAGIPWNSASATLLGIGTIDGPPDAFCAHNAEFEKQLFNPEGSRWICTYKAALRLWPDSPRHSNQVLRYFLGIDLGAEAMPPHRALPDCWVTAHILMKALEQASIEDLAAWTDEPPYLTKITFGKHRGKLFSEAPRDYLAWCLRQDMDPGVIAACKRTLAAE
jgi:exodeoxyribonuclease X